MASFYIPTSVPLTSRTSVRLASHDALRNSPSLILICPTWRTMTGRRPSSMCLCLLCRRDTTTRMMPIRWRSNLSIDASVRSSNQASRTLRALAIFIGVDSNSSGDRPIVNLNSESMEKSIHQTRFWRWSLDSRTLKDVRLRRQLSRLSFILIQRTLPALERHLSGQSTSGLGTYRNISVSGHHLSLHIIWRIYLR